MSRYFISYLPAAFDQVSGSPIEVGVYIMLLLLYFVDTVKDNLLERSLKKLQKAVKRYKMIKVKFLCK